MIVSVQFDLSKPEDASKFLELTGMKDAPMAYKTTDAAQPYQVDPALEFPLKNDLPAISIQSIQTRFKACQDMDAAAAKDLMKGFLSHHGAKAVKDLSDDDRLALMADLDDFLGGKFSPSIS
jgi:DNA-binding GntR family transcriptional regulator